MKVLEYPDQILETKSAKIDKITKEISDLALEMRETLKVLEGVGLAAPQIGKNIRLCVLGYYRKNDDKELDEQIDIPELIMINPEITWQSQKKITELEGCLSFPRIEYMIARPEKLHLRFIDEDGVKKKLKAKGLLARAVCHEIDHLDGVLIKDRKNK